MSFMRTLSLLCLLAALAGCNLKEKYARNNAAAASWLESRRGSAGINVGGNWDGSASGWGMGRFEQSGSSVRGALGNYAVRGVINGSTLYLTFHANGWVYYTAILRKTGSSLSGFYSPSVPFSELDQSVILLQR